MVMPIGCPPLSPFGLGSAILFTDSPLIFSFHFFYLISFRFFTLYLLYLLLCMDWPPMQSNFLFIFGYLFISPCNLEQIKLMTSSCRWSRHVRCFCLHKHLYLANFVSRFSYFSTKPSPSCATQLHLVEWAIALHGMYKSALVFISIFKQKNLYIVGCVQCIWE